MLFIIALGQYYCIALGQYYCITALYRYKAVGGRHSSSSPPPEAKLAPHLDLLDGVHDEHVLQVLHGALHPVVEGRCPLGVFQVQLINGLQLLLCFLWGGKSHVG